MDAKYKCPESPITESEKQAVIDDRANIDLLAKSRTLNVTRVPFEVPISENEMVTRYENRYVSEFKEEPMFIWVTMGPFRKTERTLSYDAARLYGLDPRKAAYYAIISNP